jgi:protein TonB
MVYATVLIIFSLFSYNPACAQSSRKVRSKVDPVYPELARRNNISGSVRVELVIAPDGKIKDIKILGGNPVLVQAVVAAVTQWKYEPAPEESNEVRKFDFNSR